jgi:hypothetical protein
MTKQPSVETKIKIKRIKDEYDHTIYFLMGKESDVVEWLQKKYHKELDSAETGCWFCEVDNNYHIFLDEKFAEPNTDHLAIVVHELMHLTHHALSKLGFRLSDDSEEAYAYYLQKMTLTAMPIFWGSK